MTRLYFRIYLHFVAIIVVFGAVIAIGWMLRAHDDEPRHRFDTVARLVAQALPEDPARLAGTLGQLSKDFDIRLALYRDDGAPIARAGTPAPPSPEPGQTSGDWRHGRGGPVFMLRLPDGRWLSAQTPPRPRGRLLGMLVALAAIAAAGAWPLARRITRRIERLRTQVDALGAGDLGVRVDVEGADEVAALARSFNRAAERIESLVSVQRTMLTSASHELRTPLARMRMAIELFAADPRPALRERIERDIAELDRLVDELLLTSRLQTVRDPETAEPVDLLALAAEEGARVGAVVTGDPVEIVGDRRLLRHLARNLFENARRHGAGTAIGAAVDRDGNDGAMLRICDRGPGVPEGERERIFDPFYRGAARREEGAGVGLGLHLVKVIAERHGATVEHRPNAPAGSCFVVRFPASAGPRARTAAEHH